MKKEARRVVLAEGFVLFVFLSLLLVKDASSSKSRTFMVACGKRKLAKRASQLEPLG